MKPLIVAILFLTSSLLEARITKITVTSRTSVFNGQAFGTAGAQVVKGGNDEFRNVMRKSGRNAGLH